MEPVRCRVKRSLWWLVGASVLMGAFFLDSPFQIAAEQPKSSPWPLFIIFGPVAGFSFWGAVYGALSLLREEIIADQNGLRWRGIFGPWKSARWEEISDFYLSGKPTRWSVVQTSPSLTIPTVETPRGKLKMSRAFARLDEIMPLIAARALNAPVREWEIREFRASENFSQRFNYWTKTQKWQAPIMTLGAIYVLGFFMWGVIFGEPSRATTRYEVRELSDWLSVAMAVVRFGPFAAMMVFSMVFSPWMAWRQRNFAYQHRDEHVEISPRGLAWQNGETRLEACWEEVRAIRFIPARGWGAHYRVETQNGDFSVWNSLEGRDVWLRLVRHFAPQLALEIPNLNLDLGGEAATWSGGKVGQGVRIFHFRTHNTRLTLWAATVFAVVVPLLPLLMHALQTPDDIASPVSWKPWAWALLVGVLALCYLWRCFYRAAIWANETGLEWRFPFFKARAVRWNEIESFGRDESGVFVSVGSKKRRLWRAFAPARQEELLQLIAARATNATGKWD